VDISWRGRCFCLDFVVSEAGKKGKIILKALCKKEQQGIWFGHFGLDNIVVTRGKGQI